MIDEHWKTFQLLFLLWAARLDTVRPGIDCHKMTETVCPSPGSKLGVLFKAEKYRITVFNKNKILFFIRVPNSV